MSGERSNKFAVYIAIGKLLAMAAQFVMPMFLTRFLTKADYGLYAQFYLALNFLGAILCFGIPSNLFYFHEKKHGIEQTQVVWNTFMATIVMGFFGVSILFIPVIGEYFLGQNLYQYLYIFVICLFFFIPSHIINTLPVVRKDKITTTLYPPSDIILKIILVITFALIFKSIKSIFIAISILQIAIVLFLFIYINKHYPITRNLFSVFILKEQLAYSIPFGIAVALNTICARIDKLVCISYLTVEEYATYSIAFFGIPGIMQIYDSICQVNVQNMASVKENDSKGIIQMYKSFVVKTLSFSLPIILIVFLFSEQIIEFLFTDKYLDATPYFQLYILTFIVGMLGSGTILRAIGKTRYSMYAFLASTIICIPSTYILIINYGINGAIISAMINVILPKIFQIAIEMRLLKTPFRKYFPLKNITQILITSVVPIIPIVIISMLTKLSIIYCILLGIIYVCIVYCVEIKYNIFLIDRNSVSKIFATFKNRIAK